MPAHFAASLQHLARLTASLGLERLTRNDVHAALLLGGLGLFSAVCAWL